MLLDQPDFECDPVTRADGDTPLHSVIRWLNSEPPAQRPFGRSLIDMMIEAGSNPLARNRAGLTPFQLTDPSNEDLRDFLRGCEFAHQNAGDFITVQNTKGGAAAADNHVPAGAGDDESDDDAEFSGSDEDERAEWERRRKERQNR